MKNAFYWLVGGLLSTGCVARATAMSMPPTQVAAPAKRPQPKYWRHHLTGRRYPLPSQIGGQPVSFYLTNPRVSPLAKALYTGRFRPSDTDSTTRLLALVTTTQADIRPFYRWCLDFTIILSDGALGEYPGAPALAYAEKYPQEFFAYMDKDATGQRYWRWVEIIAYSGLNYNETAAQQQQIVAVDMRKHCVACSPTTAKRISTFAKDVVEYANRNDLLRQ